MGYIGVLVAVELKNASVGLFLSPLSLESHHKIVDIHIESHDGLSVVESGTGVLRDLLSIVSNDCSVDLEVILSLLNSHGELKNLNSKGLDGYDLVRVDIDLIVEELEISKATAERTLREHHGNVVEALSALTN